MNLNILEISEGLFMLGVSGFQDLDDNLFKSKSNIIKTIIIIYDYLFKYTKNT